MADVAGLVIGAIALASLFSTCVELFDVFELGRNYIYDYRLACTKISLLRARLSRWGLALNVEAPGYEYSALREHWPEEQDIVGRSLLGIKDIFNDTSLLVERYRLAPKRARKLISRPIFFAATISQGKDSTSDGSAASNRFLLRKRTLWAIHDKNKFDDLIGDLSFLVENLEKVTDRLQMSPQRIETALGDPSEMSQQKLWTVEDFESQHLISPSGVPSALAIQDWRDHVCNQANERQEARKGELHKIFMPRRGSVVVDGTQDNKEHSIGIQGPLGQTSMAYMIKGKQTNSGQACGIQGGVSVEAFAIIQAQRVPGFDPSRGPGGRRDTDSSASDKSSNSDCNFHPTTSEPSEANK